ncbi:MAG: hypothetical protein H6832_17950 [Planctomycetes bacterium]|nr:hypothetical protein [Planctomycetota bacterium]MCB9920289.1 hypothetical protein [Planctomycetota bacterium]
MGWLRTLFLGDIGNRLDIADTEEQIRKLHLELRKTQREKNSTDASQDAEIAKLHGRVAQLELTIGALCSLMVRKQLMTESDLRQFVNSLDPEEDS